MITTALSPQTKAFAKNRFLQILAAIYAGVWVWAAIKPYDRSDWLLENMLVFAAVAAAVWICRVRPLSDVSNVMVTVFLIFHTVGSHYTYSLVPLGDWIKETAGLERNHYDRVIHFTFGFLLTYPLMELLARARDLKGRWVAFVAFLVIATASGIYELIEWAAAAIIDPKAGIAFLGTQGDVFDAQKDHALALVGSLITLALVRLLQGRFSRKA